MKRMKETKLKLSQSEEFKGKISETIEEQLCTRHGGKHVGEAINTLAKHRRKLLKKSKPVIEKKQKDEDTQVYNAKVKEFTELIEEFELSYLELKVLSSNKAYNYFKKSWKKVIKSLNNNLSLTIMIAIIYL